MNLTTVHNSTLAAVSYTFLLVKKKYNFCSAVKILLNFFVSILFSFSSFAQDSSITTIQPTNFQISKLSNQSIAPLTNQQINKRVKIIAATNLAGYGGVMVGLYGAWYKNYPQSNFHFFNDIKEWQQMDKIGHLYSAYTESKISMELWRWTGIEKKKRIWIGGMSGAFYQTVIEVLDGFSSEWGWSWGDFGANIVGSSMLVAQELAWDEQRIQLKFSFHRKYYTDPTLNQRSDKIFGSSTAERFLKDYNGQTYWLSANIRSFFSKSKWPKWLNIAVGTGAEGMFGASENIGTDANGNINFNRTDIKRYRQWYLSPDIDLTKIKTKHKGIKLALRLMNVIKFPMPALEYANGKFKFNAISF